jgi:hypothetical protein
MEPNRTAAGVAVHSLLSLLAEGSGRHAALALLHERALQATSGSSSLLFEPHPTTGHLHPTSGAGLDLLSTEPWAPGAEETALVSAAFVRDAAMGIDDLATRMPQLAAQLAAPGAVLLPLSVDERRVGLLTIGVSADPERAAAALAISEVGAGFTLALELGRLRQRDAFERDVRLLLDDFTSQLSSTLDVRAALGPLCAAAARLFAADRLTLWTYDRDSRALHALASSDDRSERLEAQVRADDPLIPAAAALRTHGAGLASQGTGVTATLTGPLRGYRRALGTLVFEGVRIEPGDDLALLNRADELGRRLASAIEITQLLDIVAQGRSGS